MPVTIDTPIDGQWRIRWEQPSDSFIAQHRLDGEVTVDVGGHHGDGELAYTFQLERRLGFLLPSEATRRLQQDSYRVPGPARSTRASASATPAGAGIGTLERPAADSVVRVAGQPASIYGEPLALISLETDRLPSVELGHEDAGLGM